MTKLFKRYEHEIEEILEKQPSEFLPGTPNETDLRSSSGYRKIIGATKQYLNLTIGPGTKLMLVLLFLIPILLISMGSYELLSAILWIVTIFLTIKFGVAFLNTNQPNEKRWRGRAIEHKTRLDGTNHFLDKILRRRRL